ncbi:MAG: BMC domain-containing protein [Elusimicrobiaceae bacterium]|nr:BMC domain-containing protein [Elusimicrobiaceae bacterium]
MNNAIGGVELSSIAKGFETADAMLKTAPVELILSRTVCPGKYVALVAGGVAEVTASVNAGVAKAAHAHVDNFIIPNVHPGVFPALAGTVEPCGMDALGLIECFSVSALIEAADAAAKTAEVTLLEIRLAMALGGKAFVSLTGTVAAVEAAVGAGAKEAGKKGLLIERVVIPQPRPELLREIL